jgi:hypothetical protein
MRQTGRYGFGGEGEKKSEHYSFKTENKYFKLKGCIFMIKFNFAI